MKIFKIIFINIILIILLSAITYEIYCAKLWKIPLPAYYNLVFKTMSADEYFDKLYAHQTVPNAFTVSLRREENINSTKSPLILMGCSFAYGFGHKRTRTPSAILAKMTGRPVYNYAGNGWGLNQFLYQLKRPDFYENKGEKEPKYIFYVIMQDHVNRIPRFKVQPEGIEIHPHFEEVNGHLTERKQKFYEKFFIALNYQMDYNQKKSCITYDRIKLYFEEAESEIHKHWPHTQLVVLIYPISDEYKFSKYYLDFEQELEKKLTDIKTINLNKLTNTDLTQEKYSLLYDYHPSSEAWDLIFKNLVKELNLNEDD